MRTCFRIQLTTELNQKLTKSMPRRHSIRGVYTREKYRKTLGLKRGEGVCSKGAYFREPTVYVKGGRERKDHFRSFDDFDDPENTGVSK